MTQHPPRGIHAKAPTLIEVWAPSCSSCRAMEVDLRVVAEDFNGRVILEQVNAPADPARVRELRAKATPTLIGVRDGEEVFRSVGWASRSELEEMFSSLEIDATPAAPIRRSETMLAGFAGSALVAFGFVSGPSIPLLVIGAGVLSIAVLPYVRRWHGNRP